MANKEIFLNSGAHRADLPKGTFDKSFTNHLTAKYGYLYPCLVEEAVAGSTYKIRPDMVFDLMPMAMPLQAKMHAHLSIFNVPFRILMKSFKDFTTRVGNHEMPYIARSEKWVTPGSLADYMGVPTAQVGELERSFNCRFAFRSASTSVTSLGVLPSDFPEGVPAIVSSPYIQTFYPLDSFNVAAQNFNVNAYNVVSDLIKRPFIGREIFFSVYNTLSSPSLANSSFYLDFLISRKNQDRYQVFHLSDTSHVISYSSAATQPDNSFKIVSSINYNIQGFNQQLYSHNVRVRMSSSIFDNLNRVIESGEFDVRMRILYTAPSAVSQFFGIGALPSDFSDYFRTYQIVSSFDKVTEGQTTDLVPDINLSAPSTIGNDFSYTSLFESLEDDRGYFQVGEDGQPPKLPINALAFRAYEFIYNKYFRNLQVDKFYKNGEVSYNEYITNDGDGADSTTPVELKRVPYEYDMYTTALPSPQAGFAPLVGITTNDETGIGLLHMIPLVDGQPDPSQAYDIGVSYNSETGDITGVSNYEEVANKTSVARLREAIDFGISINDLRNVSAYQRLKEKMQKCGYEYQPFYEEFFGTTPPIGEEFPEYLGGFTRAIQVGKIQNTALTEDTPLGMFAGVGGVSGSSRTIKVYTKEASFIMGVIWFSVTPTYSQMLPKHFLKFHPLDFFNPTFNAIGPQPIHTHEITPLQLTEENLMQVFGYQRPWYDYTSRVDECHGEFRTSMRHYLFQRIFSAPAELVANFINIHSEELTDVFTYTVDSDKLFGYVNFDIKCKSPVARVSVPRIIG